MPKTQQQVAEELKKDRADEAKVAERREAQQQKMSLQRVAAALPGMPGPKPGGLAEAMANPEALQQSLQRSRQRQEDYEQAARESGIKDVRMPANTPGNRISFAEGATAKPGTRMTVNTNPRFATQPVNAPAPEATPTPVPGPRVKKTPKK